VGEGAARQIGVSLGAVAWVFRYPEMRRIQLAWAGVSLSMWCFAIALGVYAFDVGGAAAVGIAGLVRLLPGAFASPIAGLLGDLHSRRARRSRSAAPSCVGTMPRPRCSERPSQRSRRC